MIYLTPNQWLMKCFILLFLLTSFIGYSQNPIAAASCCEEDSNMKTILSEGRCSGDAYCTACKSCTYCAHCTSGGSCGVCAGYSTTETVKAEDRYVAPNRVSSYYYEDASKAAGDKYDEGFVEDDADNYDSKNYTYGSAAQSENTDTTYAVEYTRASYNPEPKSTIQLSKEPTPEITTAIPLKEEDEETSWGWYAIGALVCIWILSKLGKA